MSKREFTGIYQKRGNCYIAWIGEIPGVNTQGRTKKEARENLKEALELILSANYSISAERSGPKIKSQLLREPIRIAVPA